ncbi:hypothetical protein [Streptomyces canus]|uniref:hypothetical protein n=1 Tax=Streptomyces canus TaxID=58343 RepID=UPI0036E83EFF
MALPASRLRLTLDKTREGIKVLNDALPAVIKAYEQTEGEVSDDWSGLGRNPTPGHPHLATELSNNLPHTAETLHTTYELLDGGGGQGVLTEKVTALPGDLKARADHYEADAETARRQADRAERDRETARSDPDLRLAAGRMFTGRAQLRIRPPRSPEHCSGSRGPRRRPTNRGRP